jgi:hypothetical protein
VATTPGRGAHGGLGSSRSPHGVLGAQAAAAEDDDGQEVRRAASEHGCPGPGRGAG